MEENSGGRPHTSNFIPCAFGYASFRLEFLGVVQSRTGILDSGSRELERAFQPASDHINHHLTA